MALVELVSRGEEDLFLTKEPQMTFFKAVYRRNTIFTTQHIPHSFANTPDFNKKVPCIINRVGDLISDITLVITLPSISKIYNDDQSIDEYTKFAWIRKIGFGIIKNIELKIGNTLIQQFTGEWLNIYYQLHKQKENLDKMIGNVEELFSYDKTKDEYTLLIPLPFWFSQSPNLALPMCCLNNHNVEITLELEDAKKCYNTSPSHYILMNDYICQFEDGEYITQNINGSEIVGRFNYFDSSTKRLYYSQISNELFNIAENDDESYLIKGSKSGYYAMPFIKTNESELEKNYSVEYSHKNLSNLRITDCFLLINYIYLDKEEKMRFLSHPHEYLVEQINESTTQTVSSNISVCNLGLKDPVKYLVWYVKQNNLNELYNNDKFNYTNSYAYNDILFNKIKYSSGVENINGIDVEYNYPINKTVNDNYNYDQAGESLIKNCKIMFNGIERVNESYKYFHDIQVLNYFYSDIQKGLCVYSFSIDPLNIQPSGSCNMNKIDNVKIQLELDDCINENNLGTFKCYSVSYNWLRIHGGVGGLLFVN